MKKTIISLLLLSTTGFSAYAQTEVSLTMGSSYANNVWYNLDNEENSSSAVSNWDIAIAATNSQASDLTTSILFNSKKGKLYAVPSATPATFNAIDTTGLNSTWTPLYNDPTTWTSGAFNQPSVGGIDYGWGSYNMMSHSIDANRVFVVKYKDASPGVLGVAYKLHITLNTIAGTYTLVYDKLDNSDIKTETITIADYNTKNFLYYSLNTQSVVDREPATANWDLVLTQYFDMYPATEPTSMQEVGGVLHNHGVEVAQAKEVDAATYEDYSSQTFSTDINTIGYDWKYLNYMTFVYETESSWVYFVKRKNNDIWKVVFTGFGGSSNGNVSFTKEKIHSATTSVFNKASQNELVVYPNPSTNGSATVLFDCKDASSTTLELYSLAGIKIKNWEIAPQLGLNAYTVNTAELNPGIYLVSIRANETLFQQKLIVK